MQQKSEPLCEEKMPAPEVLCEQIRACACAVRREIRALDVALATAEDTDAEEMLASFRTALLTVSDAGEPHCCGCGAAPATVDAEGLAWCESPTCRMRRDLLAFGRIAHYPVVRGGGYACAAGSWHWMTAALLESETAIAALMAAIIQRIEEGEDER